MLHNYERIERKFVRIMFKLVKTFLGSNVLRRLGKTLRVQGRNRLIIWGRGRKIHWEPTYIIVILRFLNLWDGGGASSFLSIQNTWCIRILTFPRFFRWGNLRPEVFQSGLITLLFMLRLFKVLSSFKIMTCKDLLNPS